MVASDTEAARTPHLLQPGQTFGERAFLEGHPSDVTLRARDHCEIWLVHRADALALAADSGTEPRARPPRRWLRRGGYLVAAIGLLMILARVLPPVRQATALVPMGLGLWCRQRGHDRCAENEWTVAASLVPDNAGPLLALGMVYLDRGDLALAEQAFGAAENLAPNWPEVHSILGFIYAGRGQHERAVESFRRALELEPGSAAAEYNLALSLQALGDHAAALSHLQAALALGGPQVDLLVNMAIAYYETGQFGKAIQAASAATSHSQDSAPAYTVLGATALKL